MFESSLSTALNNGSFAVCSKTFEKQSGAIDNISMECLYGIIVMSLDHMMYGLKTLEE